MFVPFLTGFALGASLIIAIGAQNAFILRQGLLGQHVFILCLICAMSDALLILAGVAGLGTLIEGSPGLLNFIRLGGAAFLFAYAFLAFHRVLKPQSMEVHREQKGSLGAAISTCLAFTFLNPHVYLDTVVLLGSLSAQYQGEARIFYAAGAMVSSFAWFFALGYGASLLVPFFQNPRSWQILDGAIALVMASIGLSLLLAFLA